MKTLIWTNKYVCALVLVIVNICVISRALVLYPKGATKADGGKWLSIYMCLAEDEKLQEDEVIFTKALMRVIDPRGSNHYTGSSRAYKTLYNIIFNVLKTNKS